MSSASTTIGGTRRGGPSAKFYWVENGQITAIKRFDYDQCVVHGGHLIDIAKELFPRSRTFSVSFFKFQDDTELIDLHYHRVVFNAESGDVQIKVYVFASEEEALKTLSPPTVLGSIPKPSQVEPPMSQSSSTQVSFPSATVTVPQARSETLSEYKVSAVPQPEAQASRQCEAKSGEGTGPTSNLGANNGPSNQGQPEASDSEAGHYYVVCDGCNNDIPSHRYKCLQCPDFDLCGTCEAKGLHPEHLMVRVPLHFVHAYGPAHREVLYRVVGAAAREFSDNVVIDLGKQLKETLKVFGIELEHIGEGKYCDGRRRSHKGKHCPYVPKDKRSDSKHHHLFKKCHRRDMREEMQANQTVETESGHCDLASSGCANMTTATAPPAPSTPCGPTATPAPAPAPTPAPAPPSAPAPLAPLALTTVTDSPVYPLVDFSPEVVAMEEDSPRPGEWLMVDRDGGAAAAEEKPASCANPTHSPVPFLHSDDIVNIALEKLAMMGYRIDDPMLVNIVEDCKGDITRILDCLHF